jgi:opacity protein-like surface antigen
MVKRFKCCLLVLTLLVPAVSFAQKRANVGIFAGTSYYMGDINPNRHFYRPSFSFGMIYRYNLNTRYAIRANGYIADLSGNDLDFPERLNPDRPVSPANFQTSLLDLGLQVEFNFLPYTPNIGKWAYSPYISTGIAGALIMGSDADAVNTLSFPFGIGVKLNISSRLATGAEWSFRKTFTDHLDGVVNPSGTNSFVHNNDWYSFMGIFITYKFFNFAKTCPAYN